MPDCIVEPELTEFMQGKLPESRAEEITSHIDDCESCQDTVIAMSGEDTFVEGLRKDADQQPELQDPALKHGIQRLLTGMQLSSVASAEAPVSPQRIGPYVIEAKLGDGGMGTVFRAQHSKLKRTVALKVLPSHRWSNAQAIARFEREMEAIGQLDHPHIVRASDAGEDEGMHYLVMEYVDGLDLARLAKRLGPLPVADACELARQAAIGLQNAHDNGLVHRDVKPSNLMLAWERSGGLSRDTKPSLKILDLGLALLGDEHLREEHDVTTVGALMGTLDYMSPEQGIDSHSVDHRTDIYGLGATLFKLLTGRAPYADPQYSTLMKKMTALATKAAPSLGKVRPELPANVVKVVDKMLARDPDERFATARDVAEALAEPAEDAKLGELLRTGVATEDPEPTQDSNALVRLNQATATLAPKPAEQTGQGSGWKKWLIAAALSGLLVAAGAVYQIATDYGEIIVTSKSGDLKVAVKQNGEIVREIRMEAGQGKTRVRSGQYEIEVIGDDAEIVIQPKGVDVLRNSITMIPIKSRESTVVAPRSFKDEARRAAHATLRNRSPASNTFQRTAGKYKSECIELDLEAQGSLTAIVGATNFPAIQVKNISDQTQEILLTMTRWTSGIRPEGYGPADPQKGIEQHVLLAAGQVKDVVFPFRVYSQGQQRFEVWADEGKTGELPLGGTVSFNAIEPQEPPPGFFSGKPAQTKSLYRVEPGDVLGVHIPGVLGESNQPPPTHNDANGLPLYFGYPIQVREDGLISLPYIKQRKVAGLTLSEIEADLMKAYTTEKVILHKGEAVILVSMVKKSGESVVPKQGRPVLSNAPRYDGRTLSEWLNDVKFERSPKRLGEAMEAVAAMIGHPGNASLVDTSLDEIMALMRESGKHPVFADKFSEKAWLTFFDMPVDKVADRIVSEIAEGTTESRQFLLYVWGVAYGHTNTVTQEMLDFEKQLRAKLGERSESVLAALEQSIQSEPEWTVDFLFQLSTQTQADLDGNSAASAIFEQGLRSKLPMTVAKSIRQLAYIAPDTLNLADGAKKMLVELSGPERKDLRPLFLVLQALERLGPEANALPEVTDLLGFDGVLHEANYNFGQMNMTDPLPDWRTTWQGGMGGGMVVANGEASGNLLRLILRILPTYGAEAPAALPQLVGYYSRSHHGTQAEVRATMLEIDPTLEGPVVMVLCKDKRSVVVNAFGEFCSDDSVSDPEKTTVFDLAESNTVDDLKARGKVSDKVTLIAAALKRIPAFRDTRLRIGAVKAKYIPITSDDPRVEIRWSFELVHPRVMAGCVAELFKQLAANTDKPDDQLQVIDLVPITNKVAEEIENLRMKNQQFGGGMF